MGPLRHTKKRREIWYVEKSILRSPELQSYCSVIHPLAVVASVVFYESEPVTIARGALDP